MCTQIGYTYLHIPSLVNKYSVLKGWVYISAVKFQILGCSRASNLKKNIKFSRNSNILRIV